MKKILFAFIILMLMPTIVLADDATIPVIFSPGASNGGGHGRGDLELPKASYSAIGNFLTIEFESEESCLMVIEDVNSIIWYTGPVNTSGHPTDYYVNLQSNNTYTITISSANYTYSGILEL